MHAHERFLHGIAITRSHINSFSRVIDHVDTVALFSPDTSFYVPSYFKIIELKTLSNVHTTFDITHDVIHVMETGSAAFRNRETYRKLLGSAIN
jgi:hypothetical protein